MDQVRVSPVAGGPDTGAAVTVVRCDASHDEEWNRFVLQSPQASFYHRAEWRRINERSFGHETAYLAARAGRRIVGVLPLVRLSSPIFGTIGCSLPFVNYGGPAAESAAIEQRLLDEAARVADEWDVDYLELRSLRHLGPQYPTSEHKVSMTVRLDPDPQVVWKAYRAKAGPRQEIHRGYANGFTAEFGGIELLDRFYELMAESWRDMGTPIYRRAYLAAVLEAFPSDARICVVSAPGGRAAGAALCGHHRDTVEGLWLAVRQSYRRQMIGYVLYWELIKDACERGFSTFHLGRSTKDSGGQAFKHKWGAEAVPLYWQYVLRKRKDIPSLNVQNPRYRLAIRLWRRLPVPVTQAIGPFIARAIP